MASPNNSFIANGIVVHNSFNKSHALAYGILAYWSMWFKVHYPTEFYWAQLVKIDDKNVAQRFILEAKRKGIQFGEITLRTNSSTWDIIDGAITPGWESILGVGEKAAEELLAHGPYETMAQVIERCKKSIVHSGVRTSIASTLGTTVDDLYGLRDWELVQAAIPQRQAIIDINEGVYASQRITIAGRVTRLNKKNRMEEYKDKGKDTSKLDPNGPLDYVILIVQDETDSTMVYLSPEQYVAYNKEIWLSEDSFIAVEGNKMPNVQLIIAQAIKFEIIPNKPKKVKPVPPGPKPPTKDIGIQAQ